MGSADMSIIQQASDNTEDLRLVLIGKTGTGKSRTGNTILNDNVFRSVAEASSVTGKCQLGRGSRWGRRIQVVDTPGLFDTGLTQDQVADEIRKCVAMSAPGPHAIILVTSVGRFTKEDCDTVAFFRKMFGEDMVNFLIVLFTRRDDLDDEGRTLDDYLTDTPPDLSRLLQGSGHRYVAFNNKASPEAKSDQVQQLLEMVDLVVCQNDGGHYSTAMFQAAEAIMQHRSEELRAQHEQERSLLTRTLTQCKVDQQNKILDFHKSTHQMTSKMAALENRVVAVGRKEADRLRQELAELRQLVAAMEESHKMQIDHMALKIRKQAAILAQDPPNFRQVARQEVCQGKPGLLQKLAIGLRGIVAAIASKFILGLGFA